MLGAHYPLQHVVSEVTWLHSPMLGYSRAGRKVPFL